MAWGTLGALPRKLYFFLDHKRGTKQFCSMSYPMSKVLLANSYKHTVGGCGVAIIGWQIRAILEGFCDSGDWGVVE